MVKLTILYNLPGGADQEAFIKWRVTQGQQENAASPGVLKTDFYVAKETVMGAPKYRYVTEAYFAALADLEASFFSDEAQAKLKEDLKMLGEVVFLISEEFEDENPNPVAEVNSLDFRPRKASSERS